MKELDMEAIHAVELEMLKAVDALCEKHGIRYTMYCGTLLGAVRHGGFIPWDDDVDLAMPLKDYRKFLRVAKELPKQFVCCHYGNTPDYFFPWARIAAEGTTYLPPEYAALDIPWGLVIDIYPFVGTWPSLKLLDLQNRLLLFARRLRHAAAYRARGDEGFVKKLLCRIPFPIRKALSDILLRLVMRDPEKAERVGTIDAAPLAGKYTWSDWRDMIRLPFEDGEFMAPANYDRILRKMYGDYMQLPPPEQRTGHSIKNIIIDPNRDYQLYRQEILNR